MLWRWQFFTEHPRTFLDWHANPRILVYLGLQHAWVSVAISDLDAGFHEHRFAHLWAGVQSWAGPMLYYDGYWYAHKLSIQSLARSSEFLSIMPLPWESHPRSRPSCAYFLSTYLVVHTSFLTGVALFESVTNYLSKTLVRSQNSLTCTSETKDLNRKLIIKNTKGESIKSRIATAATFAPTHFICQFQFWHEIRV